MEREGDFDEGRRDRGVLDGYMSVMSRRKREIRVVQYIDESMDCTKLHDDIGLLLKPSICEFWVQCPHYMWFTSACVAGFFHP